MIRVLIVDDSKVVQEFMRLILTSDSDIKVIGVAGSGKEAIELVKELRPDVITMDFHMPEMDGYEATRLIMETVPTPIVIVSGSMGILSGINSLKLIENGALSIVLRPSGVNNSDFLKSAKDLIQTVKLMSEIKVVKLFPGQRKVRTISSESKLPEGYNDREIHLIAIGASTGGPVILQKILSRLPKELPVPILIVQHIAAGFVKGFVDWLSISSGIPIEIASDGETLKAGTGYIAPDGYHMGVDKGPVIVLSTLPPENGLRPSIDYLFRTVAHVMGKNAIGILLTGMGKDGAVELLAMKDKGAITIAQDEESSLVFGMPGEAIRIGAADHILSLEEIVDFFENFAEKNRL
jgi:two-component system chemotaxis response regulator CheB